MKKEIMTAALILTAAIGTGSSSEKPSVAARERSSAAKVYYTRDLTPEGLLKVYAKVNSEIQGRVAIKWHSGEPHGPNILPIPMVKALQSSIPNSTLAETNTLYPGGRRTTEQHRETLKVNGWTFCPVDIMDESGTTMLPIKGGRHFKEMSMGKNILNYDSMVVLTHFKGHSYGGFGGSIKNIAIGCADGNVGKDWIHGLHGQKVEGEPFPAKKAHLMEHMVESAKATVDHFGKRITFVNVMRNMSVDCDCAGTSAARPTARDIGILASTDIVAVDQACLDLLDRLPEDEKHDLQERIRSREGEHQLEYGEEMGLGTRRYELIEVE